MFNRVLVIATVAALFVPSEQASGAAPISEWKLEPSDARCVAVRQYGSSDKPITLALKASLHGNAIQLAILRSGYRKSYAQTETKLEVDGQSFATTALSYPLGGDKRRVTHLINLDSDPSAALRTAKTLRVTVDEGINDDFPLGQTIGMWRGLQDCVARMRETWNIGVERASRIVRAAETLTPLPALFTEDDYPVKAILAEQSGTTRIALMIDESGKVRDCTLIEASGIAVLDSRSCGIIMQRAKFTPSAGPDGEPVKSFWIQTIRWRLAG